MRTATDWAVGILQATTLAGKLDPGPTPLAMDGVRVGRPELRRPPELAIHQGRRKLPDVWKIDLQHASGRARVLHELMNHELQAIELLAMALVRFHDAPRGFRRGLLATLRDEQRHCALYRDRLVAAEGEVGQQPVSGFFWQTLSGVDDPSAFLAGLSLTLEAANLDFCRVWQRRFREAGDPETAEVIQEVYDDEIRHVATGLVWFGRWAEGDRLDAWEAALRAPLSPARARGRGFDREGRLKAGFTEAEVERLRVMGGSRGRPPRVIGFDAAVEERVAGRAPSALAARVTRDLSPLPLFLVGSEDVVVGPAPSTAFLASLAAAGIDPPRFVDAPTPEALGPFPPSSVEPWGLTPEPWGAELQPVGAAGATWQPAFAELSSKTASARRASDLMRRDPRGWVAEPGRVWRSIGEPGDGPWVVKAPLSTSGTDRIVGQGAFRPNQLRWLERTLARDGEVLWQPWYERVLDLSVHVTGGGRGLDGITRFHTGRGGVYRGATLGSWLDGLDRSLLRALNERRNGPSLRDRIEAAGHEARGWAEELGYRGPLSIDLAVVQEEDGLGLVWLETNARNTLGRVALALGTRVDRRARARWFVERRTPERAECLCAAAPMRSNGSGWVEGLLPTNDPHQASAVLTWVEVRSEG